MNIIKYCGTIFLLSVLFAFTARSQDTLTFSLQDAETRFLKENLMLIAERLELDIREQQGKHRDRHAPDPANRTSAHSAATGTEACT